MPLKIVNSLTKEKEEFRPLEPGSVKMYVCGPTVYDEPHIGHLRSAYAFEVVRNYLKYSKYKVRFVRNVTDVDDKIIEKARASKPSDLNAETVAVSQRYFDLYKKDLKKLGIEDPDLEPRATQEIPAMQELIRTLIDKGCAYAKGGDVYFDVSSFARYGEVSHQDLEQMVNEEEKNPNKKSPLDFALWKTAKEGEPSWESPWGQGRPGWHIECSAMSMKHLGETFDIHGGGRDLIFPHHENENAQSSAATGKPFVNTWIHHGLITVAGQKMSKSLKNFITLDQVLKEDPRYGTETLKLTFLGTHYSAPLDFTPERVQMDRAVWRRFYEFFENSRHLENNGVKVSEKKLPQIYKRFQEAMDNDFNTPEVLAVMHGLVGDAYREKDPIAQVTAAAAIRNFGAEVFAIVFDQSDKATALKPEIEEAIANRAAARKNKDFAAADEIRNRLLKEKNIELRDLSDGRTTWRAR